VTPRWSPQIIREEAADTVRGSVANKLKLQLKTTDRAKWLF